jgi:predicted ABC-type ATPase
MTEIADATDYVRRVQIASQKPLAIILAGHNGSGKSSLWYGKLAPIAQIPLINADRLMTSILPEPGPGNHLPDWATRLRNTHQGWMSVAQQGVQSFINHAVAAKIPFATETVFSHWRDRGDGTFESKIDLIQRIQTAGYYVLLLFVGLPSAQLSIARVQTRITMGGHAVPIDKLTERFPRTQEAIKAAVPIADAAILLDNSRSMADAFTVCHVRIGEQLMYDIRNQAIARGTSETDGPAAVPAEIAAWLDLVSPA